MEYAIILLLNALKDIASDMAILHDVDADYLMTKALLSSTLQMQNSSYNHYIELMGKNYQWIIPLLNLNIDLMQSL